MRILSFLLPGLLFPFLAFATSTAPVRKAKGEKICYRLNDPGKGGLTPVSFFSDTKLSQPTELRLTADGLFDGKTQLCRWSLNGGSGTKPTFALDGEVAVPILDPPCESPFSHAQTGNGFGDWVFMVCGMSQTAEALTVPWQGRNLFVGRKNLPQWSRFQPEKIDPNRFGD